MPPSDNGVSAAAVTLIVRDVGALASAATGTTSTVEGKLVHTCSGSTRFVPVTVISVAAPGDSVWGVTAVNVGCDQPVEAPTVRKPARSKTATAQRSSVCILAGVIEVGGEVSGFHYSVVSPPPSQRNAGSKFQVSGFGLVLGLGFWGLGLGFWDRKARRNIGTMTYIGRIGEVRNYGESAGSENIGRIPCDLFRSFRSFSILLIHSDPQNPKTQNLEPGTWNLEPGTWNLELGT